MSKTETPNFDDDNFLQDWLEKRYGSGFAQAVVDDIARSKSGFWDAPYMVTQSQAANDNGHKQTSRKVS